MLRRWLLLASAIPLAIGCVGDIGSDETDDGAGAHGSDPAALAPAAPTIHRLTRPQLENAWLDLLGEPLSLPSDLPQDDVAYGFTSIAAASRTISSVEAEKYESATYAVLDQVFADAARTDALVGCSVGAAPSALSDACVVAFVRDFTERAWRRPITDEELAAVLDVGAGIATDLSDGRQGLKFALAAVLQSPSFLFRIDVGEADPDDPTLLRYTSWEMASRLSFLLTDAPPDEQLRQAARDDRLTDVVAIRSEAARLLDDPRSRKPLVRFFRDFMQVKNLDNLKKNVERFPQFSATLGPSMRTEIERMFEDVVFEKEGDFRQLFTTRDTYVNEELAALYGVEGITGPDFHPVTLPESARRGGLLTTVGFLAMNAHETQTSPTHRGRFIQINLLCNDIPPPPAGVNTTIPPADPNKPTTFRQRLDNHRKDPACAGCHAMMDPIGFAFESYDAIGVYRDHDENDLPIDTVTEVDGHPVKDALELGELVAELPDVGACVARRFFEHAGGHLAGEGDEGSLEHLVDDFVGADYDFKALVVALVTNDGYRYASPASTEETQP